MMSRDFALLFTATLLSGVGTGLTYLGIAWVIQSLYADYFSLMILNSLGMIIGVALLPIFSKWVDQYPKVHVGVGLFIFGFIAQMGLYFINSVKSNLLPLLVIVGIISTVINTLEPVNRVALANDLSTSSNRTQTTRFLELLQQLSSFISGFFGIYFIQGQEVGRVLFLDAISFLLAALVLVFIRTNPEFPSRNCILQQQISGDSLLTVNLKFYLYLSLTFIPFVCIMAERVIFPGFFHDILRANSSTFSLQTLPYGMGAFFAISLASYFNRYLEYFPGMLLSIILHAAGMFMLVFLPTLPMTFLALFIFSSTHCFIRINRTAWLMETVPHAVFGRVCGRLQQIATIMIVVLSAMLAYLSSYVSVMTACWFLLAVSIIPIFVFASRNAAVSQFMSERADLIMTPQDAK